MEEEKTEEPIVDGLEDDDVKKDLERLKKTNDEMEKEIERTEILRAKLQRGGETPAGQTPPTDEEKLKKEAEAFLAEDD